MSDMIDRQAAIDALDVLCQEHRYKIPGKGETYSQYNEAWQDALDRAEGAIFNLPSAQPDFDTTVKIDKAYDDGYEAGYLQGRHDWGDLDSDLISRRAAIDAMANTIWHYPNECYRNLNSYEFAKSLAELGLKSLPSAQAKLSCDGCKHLGMFENEIEYGYACPCLRCIRRANDYYER